MNDRTLRRVWGLAALVSLGICLASPVLYFLGRIPEATYKTIFLIASISWFALAAARTAAAKRPD